MRTKYGTKLLKEASKQKDGVIRRMMEIAQEFKKAKAKDFDDNKEGERLAQLMDEFIELERENNAYQSIVNAMIRIENFLPDDRITNPKGRG